MFLAVAVAVCSRWLLVCVRLVRRGHGGPWELVACSVSVAVSVSSVTVPVSVSVGAVCMSMGMTRVSCISPDVCPVGQGLHIDRSIAESDSWG